MARSLTLGLWLALCAAAANADPRSHPALDSALAKPPPAIAAQFRQEVFEHDQRLAAEEWRLWRDHDRLVSERPASGTGEVWQRDGQSLIVTRLFHAHRRGVEYQPGDMGLIDAAPGWQRQALVVDPEVLRRLSEDASAGDQGAPRLRYSGVIEGARWEITLRPDLMLPTQLSVQRGERLERITLVDAHALADAPWQPTPSRDYEMIDFADLGDRERDPFVIALQAAEGGAHGHAHR